MKTFLPVALLTLAMAQAAYAETNDPILFKLESKVLVVEEALLPDAGQSDDTQIINEDALRRIASASGVDILSAPSVIAGSGQPATIHVQSEAQYFEKTGEDTFVLRRLPEEASPGVRIDTTMTPAGEQNAALDIAVRVNTLKGRKPIPGVALNVGYPEIQTQEIDAKAEAPLGQWLRIDGPAFKDVATGKRERLVVIVRVTRPADEQP